MKPADRITLVRCILFGGLTALAMLAVPGAWALTSSMPTSAPVLSRDEQLSLLKIRDAKLECDKAQARKDRAQLDLEDTQSLFDDNIVTVNELRKAQQAFKEAKIEYERAQNQLARTRLDFLENATVVRVVDANIFRGENNDVKVRIELKNDSDINKAKVVMAGKEGGSSGAGDPAALLKVDSIIVTLRGTAQVSSGAGEQSRSAEAIIGDPFQQIIPELKYGQSEVLEFRLLKKDIEHLTVKVDYLQTNKEYDVFLKKEALQELPTITSAQIDQEGELGSTIRYNLQLERLAKTDQSFSLRVLNFPEEIRFAFVDPRRGGKMTTLKFTREESIRTVDFEVSIPKRLDRSLIDKGASFYILVARPTEMEKVYELKKRFAGKEIPAEEIAKLKANAIELILIPKGVAELEILAGNLLEEVRKEQEVALKFRVMNSGTLDVHRVTPKLELPLEWDAQVTPPDALVIEPEQKVLFVVNIKPPPETGDFTVTVEAEGHSGVELIEADGKDFTVRIVPGSNVTGTVFLVGVLVLLVLG